MDTRKSADVEAVAEAWGAVVGGYAGVRDAWGGSLQVRVVGWCASTQEAALAMVLETGGAACGVVAVEQTRGRGRMGRVWEQGGGEGRVGLGVACTVGLRESWLAARGISGGELAVRAGLAAQAACAGVLAAGGCGARVGLKWPNDVVVRDGAELRKLAGVLVERKQEGGGVYLVGVGINVAHGREDFADLVRERAVSLAMVAGGEGGESIRLSVPGVACALLAELGTMLGAALGAGGSQVQPSAADLVTAWARVDMVAGTERALLIDGQAVRAVVRAISPLEWIEVEVGGSVQRVEAGRVVIAG